MTTTARRNVGTRGRLPDGQPNPIDVHIGARIRLRRTLLGMSQEKLGEAIGLTFQQVQKYERGANRIGGSRMWDLSRVLDVPVSFFYDDMTAATQAASPKALITGTAAPQSGQDGIEPDAMCRRETLELVRDYYAIPTDHQRHAIRQIIKAVTAHHPLAAE